MKTNNIICPHCQYPLDDDDMMQADCDLWAIAPNQEDAEVDCPSCKQRFWVRGGYKPEYEMFKTEEECAE